MFKRLSLAQSIILVVLLAFAATAWSVMLIADRQLRQNADRSQSEVYAERIDKIIQYLKERNERLRATGLRAAYIDAFQDSSIEYLRRAYYTAPDQKVYPFIQRTDGTMLLHPVVPTGSVEYANAPYVQKAMRLRNGEFDYNAFGEPKWAIVRTFEPWGWQIGFEVPKKIKYRDVLALRIHLLAILVTISLLTCGGVSFVIWRMTKPIRVLTRAAKAISDGKLDFVPPAEHRGDIRILTQAFVSMRDSIRERIKSLNHEIAERKHAEKELNGLRKYLANIIDSMPSVIVGVDADGTVTQWNAGAEKATGVVAREALGRSLESVMPVMSDKIGWMREAMQAREVRFEPKLEIEDNGTKRYEDITVYPLIANGVEGLVIRIDDVTDRVNLEQMMVQTEKMMSVGGLAAGMAHEINNPLSGIAGSLQNINNRIFSDLKNNEIAARECGVELKVIREYMRRRGVDRMIEIAMESNTRAALIVRNMLNFSRKSEKQFDNNDIAALLDSSLELASNDYDMKKNFDFRKIKTIKEYDTNVPMVYCERNQIQQVFLNILKNSAEAMSEKEYAEDVPRFIIKVFPRKEQVVIQIEDNGPGIDEASRKRIFEPFYTTKPVGQGTGLGLSVSYFIITDQHCGSMSVESNPGEWTRFTIFLPIHRGDNGAPCDSLPC